MRPLVLLMIMLLALSACTPRPSQPVPATQAEAENQAATSQAEPTGSQPSPAPPPPTGQTGKRLALHVAADRDGPWTPYYPGIHVDGPVVWAKIEATESLPPDAVKRVTDQGVFTPGISGERISDRVILLRSEGAAMDFSPSVLLPKGSRLPAFVAFAGRPPRLREWDPATGKARTIATLQAVPDLYTRVRLDSEGKELTYSALLQEEAVAVSLQTGESKTVPEPEWQARVPDGGPYRLAPKLRLEPGQPLPPDGIYAAEVRERAGDPGRLILDLPALRMITPHNPCLSYSVYHGWSADGKRLAVATMEPPDEVALLLVDVDTGESQTLMKRPIGDGWGAIVSWSPDERWLVFHDVLVEAATGRTVPVPVAGVSHWRPDGRFLASGDEALFRGWGPLRVIEPEQAKVHLEAEGRFIAWTPEGRMLYFDWPNGQQIPFGPRGCYGGW